MLSYKLVSIEISIKKSTVSLKNWNETSKQAAAAILLLILKNQVAFKTGKDLSEIRKAVKTFLINQPVIEISIEKFTLLLENWIEISIERWEIGAFIHSFSFQYPITLSK